MPRLLAALLLTACLAPPLASALEVDELEQGASGAEGEEGGAATVDAVAVAPGDEPARVMATARGGPGGPAGTATPAGDGGSASLGRVYGASGSGEVSVLGVAFGGAGGARSDALPGGDGAPVRLENDVDGETRGALSLVQVAHGGDAGGAGGRPGDAESLLERSKRAEALTLGASAVAGAGPGTFASELGAPGGDAGASVRGSNRGGSTTIVGLALAGPGGIRLGDRVGFDGGDAELFAAGTTRCSGCAVRVGEPAPPRFARVPDPRYRSPDDDFVSGGSATFGRVDFVTGGSGARAGAGGGGLLPFGLSDVGGDGGRATSLSIGRALRDAAVTVFDVARGGAGGSSLAPNERARGGDAESIAIGVGKGRSPVEVHADAEGGAAGALRRPVGTVIGVAIPGGSALASADAEGRGRVVADARAAAGRSSLGGGSDASAEARASAEGRSGEARAAVGSIGYNLDVEVRAIAELASRASSGARAATGASLPRRPREADVYARSLLAPPEAALLEARLTDGLLEELQAEHAQIEMIGELGGERPVGHGRAGARLAFEVDLRSTPFSLRTRVTGVAVGLGAPRLPRRGFETLRVSVIKEQEVLFDAIYRDRDEAVRDLAGRVVEVGSLGTVLESEGPRRPTSRPELARLRVELTGVRSTDEFALRYAVAADPFLIIERPYPGPGGSLGSGYLVPEVVSFPGLWLELAPRLTTGRVSPLAVFVPPELPPGFNDLSDRNDAGGGSGGALSIFLRVGPGVNLATELDEALSGL